MLSLFEAARECTHSKKSYITYRVRVKMPHSLTPDQQERFLNSLEQHISDTKTNDNTHDISTIFTPNMNTSNKILESYVIVSESLQAIDLRDIVYTCLRNELKSQVFCRESDIDVDVLIGTGTGC